jgi:hypothetical protein
MLELYQERLDGFEHEAQLRERWYPKCWYPRPSQDAPFSTTCNYRKIEKPAEPLSFWVARDEDGDLFCYNSEPSLYKDEGYFDGDHMGDVESIVNNELFPEIKAGQKVQFIQAPQVEA